MPFRQTPVTHTPYVVIAFDKQGVERNDDRDGQHGVMSARLIAETQHSMPSDVFLFSHGWQADVPSAIDQYDRWIDAMAQLDADVSRLGPDCRPLWVGVHWPSLAWGDEELGGGSFGAAGGPAPKDLLETLLDRLDLAGSFRARELMGVIFRENKVNAGASLLPHNVAEAYAELASILNCDAQGSGADPAADHAPFDPNAAFDAMNSAGVSFDCAGPLGGLLGPLRVLTFWTMKRRARVVGEGGMHTFVAQLQQAAPNARIHLMGHSFGSIVVSSICGGPGGTTPLPRAVDSLALVQGAVSLWAYADAVPATGGRGYFNAMMHCPAVAGPIITTRSVHDTALGVWYPAAVSLALQDPSFAAVNPATITWGALGAFGMQGYAGVLNQKMQAATFDYHFAPGKIYNLEASHVIKKMSGVGGAHCDIDGPEVAHAIWQAAIPTAAAAPAFISRAAAAGAGGAKSVAAAPAAMPPMRIPAPAVPMPRVIIPAQAPLTDTSMPIPFGVQAETGRYLPGLQPSDLDHILEDSQLVNIRAANLGSRPLAAVFDVDPNNLASTGWGVIFAGDADMRRKAAIQAALKPLIDRRQSEAGNLFRWFDGPTGYRRGLRADQWLTERGSGLNIVDPSQGVPYYLMIVGSPDEIPFDFEYELDMFFAVGRLHFNQPEEYAQYAQNILAYESGTLPSGKTIAVFNTRNDGDRATALLHDQVATQLIQGANTLKPLGQNQGFAITPRLADNATKRQLAEILRGNTEAGSPALLFTGSHGVSFAVSDRRQAEKQGAILTQDWGGPGSPVTEDCFFTADDVPADSKIAGMIHFFFACYSAGCPQFDTYSYDASRQPVRIGNSTIVARLPQKLLLAGAQAVIGHIDRGWVYSFQNRTGQPMVQGFRDPLAKILQGWRIGDAMDDFNQRWTALSADLLSTLQNRRAFAPSAPDPLLANKWTARDDARNYIVLGDPVVRLRTAPVPPPAASGGSFGITATVSAPSPETEPLAFEIHPEARPKLHFRDFTGKIPLKAAVSPDCSYQLVEAALGQAARGSTIDAYIYAISAPYLMQLLGDADDRGATVRVMYDPSQMRAADAQTLRQMGLDVRVAPSHDPRRVFTVCHQKFVVIDGRTVVIESANWAKSSIPERKAGGRRLKGNREWLVCIEDEAVAEWYGTLFQADWDIPEQPAAFGVEAVAPELIAESFRAPRADAPRDFTIATFTGQQMMITPLTSPDNYFDTVLPMIRSASKRIWVQQQYILGAGGDGVPRLLEAIAQRRRARVDVRLIVSSRFPENWDATKQTLEEAGLIGRLRAINLDNFIHCHNKGVIADDAVVVSSTNWSENSLRQAREAGILVHSPGLSRYFAQVFDDDWTTGWSVATADSQARSFAAPVAAGEDAIEVDPADRV